MKLKKALRLKDSCSIVGIFEDNSTLHISMHKLNESIRIEKTGLKYTANLYLEDTENYESITEHTFNRALRVVKNRILNTLNQLQ